MSESKKVSVIVPVYNTPVEFLHMCIKSIGSQTYKNIELLLIDDGSKEKIAQECDDLKNTYGSLLDGGIQVIHKSNSGVSSARNCGIEKAQGEYIVFVDSDDIIHQDFVKVLISTIEKCNCEMAVCNLKNIYGFNDYREECTEGSIGKIEILEGADIYKNTKGYIWNRIYRKTAIGNTRFNEQFYFGEDGLFLEDIITKIGKCAYVDKVLYFYRINGFGTSTNMSYKKYLQAIYMGNKQLENPYIRADKELLSKRTSVRELYRIKYMVALEAEKPENYLNLLKVEKRNLIDNKRKTWATDSELLKISQIILKMPLPVGRLYLKFLRLLQDKKQFIKKYQWEKAASRND